MSPFRLNMSLRARPLAVALVFLSPLAWADKGNGVSAGLILAQDTSGRAAALGGAVESVSDDVSAFGYNPASLASLNSNHVIVGFQRGLVDDSFSQIQFGAPLRNAGLGVSLSLYQGGQMDFIEGGVKQKTVVSQRDVAGSVGYAHFLGRFAVGGAVKYLSSQLAETQSASTVGLDLGSTVDVTQRFRLGAAAQNLGASLKYGDEKSKVTQTIRAGFSYLLVPARNQTTLLVDFPYLINESRMGATLGVETIVGPIALRGGYRTGVDLGGLSLGAGFALNRLSIDYAFGLVQELQSSHRVSLSYRFGGIPRDNSMITIRAPYHAPPTAGSPRRTHESTVDRDLHDPRKDPVAVRAPAPVPVKPSEPVPVFQGIGRANCGDEKGDSSTIFYGKGRADCGEALPPISPDFLRETKPMNGGEETK